VALSVTTITPTVRLTTRQSIQTELGISSDADLIDALIDGASAGIGTYCHRSFGREAYTETLPGYGDIHLQLARTPVATVSTVTYRSSVITDYSIADKNKGWLYRQNGWAWTAQVWPGLTGGGMFFDMGTPLARQEEPTISVEYVAGYLLPEQNVQGDVTVSAADNSFNSSALFPALLKAGDIIETTGFEASANNGRFLVTGTPTTSKVIVSATLTAQAASNAASVVKFSNLPADIQKAANECVKSWYSTRKDDPSIVEKQAGPHRIRYSEQQDMLGLGIPSVCVGLLRPYVRAA
jgi:hypothetical protein